LIPARAYTRNGIVITVRNPTAVAQVVAPFWFVLATIEVAGAHRRGETMMMQMHSTTLEEGIDSPELRALSDQEIEFVSG
jgi:hypothetical protein